MAGDPALIDEESVVIPGARVETVHVDGLAVIVDELGGRLHSLNPTGSVVWSCFDGESTLREIIDDLNDVFKGSRSAISSDVVKLAKNFATLGTIDGYRRELGGDEADQELLDDGECAPDSTAGGTAPTFDERYLLSPPNG